VKYLEYTSSLQQARTSKKASAYKIFIEAKVEVEVKVKVEVEVNNKLLIRNNHAGVINKIRQNKP
jgi:hypothetical protein